MLSTLQWICKTTWCKQTPGAKENFPVQGVQQVVTWRHLMKCKLRLTTSLSKKNIHIQLPNRIKPGAISYRTCKAMQTQIMGDWLQGPSSHTTEPLKKYSIYPTLKTSRNTSESFWKLTLCVLRLMLRTAWCLKQMSPQNVACHHLHHSHPRGLFCSPGLRSLRPEKWGKSFVWTPHSKASSLHRLNSWHKQVSPR